MSESSTVSTDSSMVESMVQQAERLLAALSSLCTKENNDVCIECDEKKFFCHGVILKARSMYFYQMVESGAQVIKVEGVRSEIMNDIISYIYTSQIEITPEKIVEMIEAAWKFQLPTLLEKSFKVFRNQINFDNAVEVLIAADKVGLEEFKAVAINRITNNRQMLMAEAGFRKKMVDNPQILLMLYEKLCHTCNNNNFEPVFSDEMSSSPISRHSSISSPSGMLWTCVCGSTATGHYCSWCGNTQWDSAV